MHLRTQSELLKAVYTPNDIILADRGLIDSFFYGWKFEKELIRTDDMDVYEINKSIYSTILKYLN